LATAAAEEKRRADNPLHVPEDGEKVQVPDTASSSDVPAEVPSEVLAAGATALADDHDAAYAAVERSVVLGLKEEQRNADAEALE
jgi:hypothetical protein